MSRRPSANTRMIAPCGCKSDSGGFTFCDLHARAGEAASLLDTIRGFYLAMPAHDGADWPFVTAIDAVVPRREQEGAGREPDL